MTARGPYATQAQAKQDAIQLRAGGHATRLLTIDRTLTERGVTTGVYDRSVTEWLARQKPETVTVILGWVERAHEAGKRAASGSPISFGGLR